MSTKKRGLWAVLFSTSSLVPLIENGLQALSRVDRARIAAEPPSYVIDSLALDRRSGSTGEWDYLLGINERMNVTEIRRWIWVSSGRDTVARGSTEWRRLIQARIELVGRRLSLP